MQTRIILTEVSSRSVLGSQLVMLASNLLKRNIDDLLRLRGYTHKDLAQWCRRSESWISKIYRHTNRGIPLKYLDRIADFFGLATYQLFQPGISPLTERRSGHDRRSGRDRRISHAQRVIRELGPPLTRKRGRPPRERNEYDVA